MTLSEELAWRGFVNQTTYKDASALDGQPITFYWGVDPSADSMTIGHLAMAMMVRQFIAAGHKAILLVGGATGLIGDPDGKTQERNLKSPDEIARNKAGIVAQYQKLFAGQTFEIVDNYEWFQSMDYLEFLRNVGKHVPMRQMLGREFVQSRLQEDGAGISYAEFSYALIQAYDFLHLHQQRGVSLQVCGADQWGNSIAGVDLIRRVTGDETHVWSAPLIINKTTGVKFGKSEAGAIWLDPEKTTPTQFYQFWINVDDASVTDYLKIYTTLPRQEIENVVVEQEKNPQNRAAQIMLARQVTSLVHGKQEMMFAETVTEYLTGKEVISGQDTSAINEIKKNIPVAKTQNNGSITEALVASGLATSNTEARRLISGNAIAINNNKISRKNFEPQDFHDGFLLLRRGKAFKDSALVELEG